MDKHTKFLQFLWITWIYFGYLAYSQPILASANKTTRMQVNIGALLPENNKWPFSHMGMLEAAALAKYYIQDHMILNSDINLEITSRDSNCSEANGMNQAINFKYKDNVSVFLGPTCDFAAAPVARQVTFWNLPMVSVGAMARDFKSRRKSVYPLLTRAGTTNLHSLADSLVRIMLQNGWKKFKLVYDRLYDGNSVAPIFCHLASESLVYGVPETGNGIRLDYFQMQDIKNIEEMTRTVLEEEVANKFSGE